MSYHIRTIATVVFGLLAGTAVYSNEMSHGAHSADAATSGNDEATLEAARADYPMTTCVVSGDALEGSGMEVFDHLYKEEGKPARLVRFCCKDCVRDFTKNPAEYLAKIDAAMAKKAATKANEGKSKGHEDHQH